jgi:hypothetical protein
VVPPAAEARGPWLNQASMSYVLCLGVARLVDRASMRFDPLTLSVAVSCWWLYRGRGTTTPLSTSTMAPAALTTCTIGYPRIGPGREMKKALEAYWAGKSSQDELLSVARTVDEAAWKAQSDAGAFVHSPVCVSTVLAAMVSGCWMRATRVGVGCGAGRCGCSVGASADVAPVGRRSDILRCSHAHQGSI